ncbi:methylthioribose kinase [Bacillus sp. RG28]|uniref:Methylthioribose kinase n=1 Tax=Gottfriedia endophytica TaxID=2820819 RepID=A0A940NPZ4_9BACI|nr:methylthioribose kinase [Gottfriedia endophytica]MBP0724792.1 methylthioribose kinase [Gottfriedia endophytica]
MIQRMIELGEGYSDLYELIELATAQKSRVAHLLKFTTSKDKDTYCSFAVIFKPTSIGDFQPIYYCREGIKLTGDSISKREQLINDLASSLEKEIITLNLRHSTSFFEKELFHQYVIGILRLNHLISPLK